MGEFGEFTVGRIGCFKSNTICLPSMSDIASDRKRERRGEGGSQNWHNATFRRVMHARVDQQRADRFLYNMTTKVSVFSYRTVRIVNRTLPSFLYHQFFHAQLALGDV